MPSTTTIIVAVCVVVYLLWYRFGKSPKSADAPQCPECEQPMRWVDYKRGALVYCAFGAAFLVAGFVMKNPYMYPLGGVAVLLGIPEFRNTARNHYGCWKCQDFYAVEEDGRCELQRFTLASNRRHFFPF